MCIQTIKSLLIAFTSSLIQGWPCISNYACNSHAGEVNPTFCLVGPFLDGAGSRVSGFHRMSSRVELWRTNFDYYFAALSKNVGSSLISWVPGSFLVVSVETHQMDFQYAEMRHYSKNLMMLIPTSQKCRHLSLSTLLFTFCVSWSVFSTVFRKLSFVDCWIYLLSSSNWGM